MKRARWRAAAVRVLRTRAAAPAPRAACTWLRGLCSHSRAPRSSPTTSPGYAVLLLRRTPVPLPGSSIYSGICWHDIQLYVNNIVVIPLLLNESVGAEVGCGRIKLFYFLWYLVLHINNERTGAAR